jgi:hypothetical protein
MIFSFRLTLLMDVRLFVRDSKECYFNIADISLITMRLDDIIMANNEECKTADECFLKKVKDIRYAIAQLLSISLLKTKIV